MVPQAAAKDMVRMIQEVRIAKPEINKSKNFIHNIVREKYQHIFNDHKTSSEVARYNFYLIPIRANEKSRVC